ncbi:MAG: alanyl-tRNA editing protein [Verrucomicrobia bacterium]|nr:alanyl-tRNA editing protein [Verrucomicrobiota bacterium]
MIERLYRQDAYRTAMQANVTAVRERKGRSEVLLDATAFYPTAGGQAHDTGRLGAARVVDVQEDAPGEIWHTLEGAAPAAGENVEGEIDWARRFDHMQQHTGEHILGQSFFRLQRPIAAVNMEGRICTIDLEGDVPWELALEAETLANEAIWAAHPVRTYEVDESEIGRLPLRRPPKVQGRIRIVQIGEFDWSACGGTHVASSAEVGLLKIFKLEKVRGTDTRVFFNCGRRLLADYRLKHDFTAALGLRLSAALEMVPERTNALLDELTATKRELAQARTRLAREMAAHASGPVECRQVEDPALLTELAGAFAQKEGAIALLGAKSEGRALLAVACGPGVGKKAGDLLKVGLAVVQGRGGGKPDLAQGSGPEAGRLAEALEAMRATALA